MVPKWAVGTVVVAACVVWVGNLVATILNADYRANEAVNVTMLAILGGIFAVSRRKDGGGKE
jgi:hypothetical protein